MALSRLPQIEPETFSGCDPLKFPVFKMAFDPLVSHKAMSDSDKLNLLNRYLDSETKAALQGYLMLPPSEAYSSAYTLLLERYGDNFKIANAFKDRLKLWPRVRGTDILGLRNFVDYLKQCKAAKRSFHTLKTLDDESENAILTRKLPPWLSRQ